MNAIVKRERDCYFFLPIDVREQRIGRDYGIRVDSPFWFIILVSFKRKDSGPEGQVFFRPYHI